MKNWGIRKTLELKGAKPPAVPPPRFGAWLSLYFWGRVRKTLELGRGYPPPRFGFALSLDAMLGVFLVFVIIGMLVLLGAFPKTQYEAHYGIARDAMSALQGIKLVDITNASSYRYAVYLVNNCSANMSFCTDNCTVENMNNTLLEQIGEFWALNKSSCAGALAAEVLSSIPDRYGVEMGFVNGSGDFESIYARSSQGYNELTVADRRVISGIAKPKPITGWAARANLLGMVKQTSAYVYFGGYEGDGNLTKKLELPADAIPRSAYMEVDVGSDFSLYVNGNFAGSYAKGSGGGGNLTPDKWNISSGYIEHFNTGMNTISINFSGNASNFIGGGFLKVSFNSEQFSVEGARELNESITDTSLLPGINGVINLYSSFDAPAAPASMEARLHYASAYPVYFVIGNSTVYRSNATGEQNVLLANANLSAMLNYSALGGKTVPLRFATNSSMVVEMQVGSANAVLVTDLSGSMNTRDVWNGSAYITRMAAAKRALSAFVNQSVPNGTSVGLASYGNAAVPYDSYVYWCIDPNIARNKSASATCSQPGYPASYVVDGSDSTFWRTTSSCTMPQNVTIDLGTNYSIDRIQLTQSGSSRYLTRAYTLYYSLNGTSWAYLANGTLPQQTLSKQNRTFSEVNARYVRFVANTSYYFQPTRRVGLSELRAYRGTCYFHPYGYVNDTSYPNPPPAYGDARVDANVSNDVGLLNSKINNYSANGGTCIACGINAGVRALLESGNPAYNWSLVIMSDGRPNVAPVESNATVNYTYDKAMLAYLPSNYSPSSDFSQTGNVSAIETAKIAKQRYNITIYTVAFGNDTLGQAVLRQIANETGGKYFSASNLSDLLAIYQNISTEIASGMNYSSQSVVVFGNVSLNNTLYPDSYVKLSYPSPSYLQYGEITISTNSPRFSEYSGSEITYPKEGCFGVSGAARVIDTRATSYSSQYWTDYVVGGEQTVFQLSNYGQEYVRLGDPFSVMIPAGLVVPGEEFCASVGTGSSPASPYGGSPDNRLVYAYAIKGFVPYGGTFPQASGCRTVVWYDWDLDGSADGNVSVQLGSANTTNCSSSDALYDALKRMLVQLKSTPMNESCKIGEQCNPIDVRLGEDIEVGVVSSLELPFMWGPAVVELRIWR